jgi:uncharacterized membrane protein (GlpM family)
MSFTKKNNVNDLQFSLNNLFSKFKEGFAFILFAIFLVLLSTLVSFIVINNSNDLENIQTTTKVAMVVNIIGYIFFIIGIYILFDASELKKDKLQDMMALINCPKCNDQNSDKAEICVGCGAPIAPLLISIIGIPIKIGNLEVAQYHFPHQMKWRDAIKACKDLGDAWRLPTSEELNIIYENKDKIGGFAVNYYWSSTELGSGQSWAQDFYDGSQNVTSKDYTFYVRAIRAF